MEFTGTHLRYLLGMYQLSQDNGEIRVTAIANTLQVKKASVARIIGVFREKQLVEQQPYGKVQLTELGIHMAQQYKQYVSALALRLIETGLPLQQKEAFDAACILLPELPRSCWQAVCPNGTDGTQ
jgi:Mn-dependent DtxR family transcriptional regulator